MAKPKGKDEELKAAEDPKVATESTDTGRGMVAIAIREVTYKAVGMQREAVDGDVLFRGEIASDVTPGDLFRMLESGKARFVDIEESPAAGD